jgi:type III restriction enzyme
MATGSGKTVVMAMLIVWHALNKFANPLDSRFGDAFLIVTPGITIRDRLRVLLPNDPENYYAKMDVVPETNREALARAKILITNYHAFLPREKVAVGKLTKQILGNGKAGAFTETPEEVVRRVCRDLGNKKNLITGRGQCDLLWRISRFRRLFQFADCRRLDRIHQLASGTPFDVFSNRSWIKP